MIGFFIFLFGLLLFDVGMFVGLMGMLVPYRPSRHLQMAALEQLKAKFRRIHLYMLPLWALSIGAFATAWHWLLDSVGERSLASLPPAIFFLHPEPLWLVWLVPALLLGFVTAFWFVDTLYRLWLRERFADYQIVSQARLGIAVKKVMAPMAVLVVLVTGAFYILVTDCYTTFEDDGMVVNRFWDFEERRHAYADIVSIVEAEKHRPAGIGKTVRRIRYHILFQDGTTWCNEQTGTSIVDSAATPDIIDFVAQRSGQPVIRAEFLEDVVPGQ